MNLTDLKHHVDDSDILLTEKPKTVNVTHTPLFHNDKELEQYKKIDPVLYHKIVTLY